MKEESKKDGSDIGFRKQGKEIKENFRKIVMELNQKEISIGVGRLQILEGYFRKIGRIFQYLLCREVRGRKKVKGSLNIGEILNNKLKIK